MTDNERFLHSPGAILEGIASRLVAHTKDLARLVDEEKLADAVSLIADLHDLLNAFHSVCRAEYGNDD